MQKKDTTPEVRRRALEPQAILRRLAGEAAPEPPRVGGVWKPLDPPPDGTAR